MVVGYGREDVREEEEEAWGGLGGATVVSGGTISGEWHAGSDG